MNRLRAPALQHIVETLHTGRFRIRHALQVMRLGDPGEFFLDRVMRGPVRNARTGEWNCDVNVIGGKCLGFAALTRSILRTHPNFDSSAARIPRGKNEFTRYSADLRGSRGSGILAAGRAEQRNAEQRKKYKV